MALSPFSLTLAETNLTQYAVQVLTTANNKYYYYVFSSPVAQGVAEQIAIDMCNDDFIENNSEERAVSVTSFTQYGVLDNPELDNEEELNYFIRKRYGEGVMVTLESIGFDNWDYEFLSEYTGPQELR